MVETVETYELVLVVVGIAVFGAAVLPRLLAHRPLSMPIVFVAGGFLLFSIPHGIAMPNPIEQSASVERLTELVVVVALMGAGLKIDRPFSLARWRSTWRLLGVTMPLTIAVTALLGWLALGLHPATAVLLGAALAPTDPVLASDVEAGPPLTELEAEAVAGRAGTVRFTLTSEAGLNDGLAFPFTNLAVALAGAAGAATLLPTLGEWLLVDVAYKIAVGVVAGYVLGEALARAVFRLPVGSGVADELAGAEVLAGTLLIYGLAEMANGYGFIAVFVGSLTLRHFEWEHDYYRTLHEFAVIVERLLLTVVLVGFGGALAAGLLAPLTPVDAAFGLAFLLVVRPVTGLVGLLGLDVEWPERAAIAGFGVRGVGSFYYLSHALAESSFIELELLVAADRLWALVGFVVLASTVLHGVTASAVMDVVDRRQEAIAAE
ncbi:cation:proton antiporter [Halorarum salinum]|uniref:Cation:proton antiporter n=1 Tax=Halorarum salinum TaxID=2743089 RepID=A0A7D5QD56_9EURY|nr:cation:proton antiporter [Halobaculum salinum]QLG64217.1 cation:proton antiporter [Halobaculum salinum]